MLQKTFCSKVENDLQNNHFFLWQKRTTFKSQGMCQKQSVFVAEWQTLVHPIFWGSGNYATRTAWVGTELVFQFFLIQHQYIERKWVGLGWELAEMGCDSSRGINMDTGQSWVVHYPYNTRHDSWRLRGTKSSTISGSKTFFISEICSNLLPFYRCWSSSMGNVWIYSEI